MRALTLIGAVALALCVSPAMASGLPPPDIPALNATPASALNVNLDRINITTFVLVASRGGPVSTAPLLLGPVAGHISVATVDDDASATFGPIAAAPPRFVEPG